MKGYRWRKRHYLEIIRTAVSPASRTMPAIRTKSSLTRIMGLAIGMRSTMTTYALTHTTHKTSYLCGFVTPLTTAISNNTAPMPIKGIRAANIMRILSIMDKKPCSPTLGELFEHVSTLLCLPGALAKVQSSARVRDAPDTIRQGLLLDRLSHKPDRSCAWTLQRPLG